MPPRERSVTEPTAARPVDDWVRFELLIPRSWRRWLDEAATARAMTVSDVVRQCIRELMIRRHDTNGGASS